MRRFRVRKLPAFRTRCNRRRGGGNKAQFRKI
jgi:hypothetical protein